METKTCPGCGTEKPTSEFGKANRRDGCRSYCKICESAYNTSKIAELKDKVYEKLGHVCLKCSFSDKRALQIDHVNGGGNKEHKEVKNNNSFLKKVLADTTGAYQLLCANCNWIKRFENREHAKKNKISESGMQKIVEAARTRVVSEESRKRMSEAHRGQVPWNKKPSE